MERSVWFKSLRTFAGGAAAGGRAGKLRGGRTKMESRATRSVGGRSFHRGLSHAESHEFSNGVPQLVALGLGNKPAHAFQWIPITDSGHFKWIAQVVALAVRAHSHGVDDEETRPPAGADGGDDGFYLLQEVWKGIVEPPVFRSSDASLRYFRRFVVDVGVV